jgi:P27 family predicted phage terminase small subunit
MARTRPPPNHRATRRGGRPPKPVQLHKIEGTYQPVRHASRGDQLDAPGELSGKRPPGWMNQAQRKLWRELLTDAPAGVLRRIDAALLANYCELRDRYRQLVEAQRQLDRAQPMPFLVKSPTGAALSPYLRAINHCVLLLTRLAAEMGFTLAARAGLPVPGAAKVASPNPKRLLRLDGGNWSSCPEAAVLS